MAMHMAHLRIDDDTEAELAALAAKLRTTRSAVMREALRRMARQERVKVSETVALDRA